MAEKPKTKSAQSEANARYTRAVAALKESHKEEFLQLLEKEYANDGLVYKRRLTPEERDAKIAAEAREKAAEKAAAALALYPDLTPEEIAAAQSRLLLKQPVETPA